MKTLYKNGKIYLGRGRFASSMLVSEGRIEAVGDDLPSVPGCEQSELMGRTVVPGFIDTHVHLASVGRMRSCVDLSGAGSMAELIDRGRKYIEKEPRDKDFVLVGRGYNEDYFTDFAIPPNRRDLDKITDKFPVVYIRVCGHMTSVNTKALELAGVIRDTTEVAGGRIGRDPDGNLDGTLFEDAAYLVRKIVPPEDENTVSSYILSGMAHAAGYGITCVHTNDVSDGSVSLGAYEKIYASCKNIIRTYHQVTFSDLNRYKRFILDGHATTRGSDMFR
ncbi:MAG: amidohydrolase family protein [Clostridiales bacterium]|jgi:predicted amidohydrolase YtcJ|nr:amidohydrolase family protein [Clostridiales bacterium]